ncbi:MAG TPA: Flp family type IVb pilin [Armatimonadota bacterium]
MLVRLVKDEEGAALVEYMLLATLVAVACVAAVTAVGTATVTKLNEPAISAALK